jgi:hypothetical protein
MPVSGRIGGVKGATVDTTTIYNYDPMFVDYAIGDYTLAEGSPLYGLGSDGEAIGDLRWATNPPLAVDEDNLPKQFRLSQNYPNPFNPNTTINFALKNPGWTTLKLYDLRGREVATLFDQEMNAGFHSIAFDGPALASGMYFYRIVSGDFVATRKMLLMK